MNELTNATVAETTELATVNETAQEPVVTTLEGLANSLPSNVIARTINADAFKDIMFDTRMDSVYSRNPETGEFSAILGKKSIVRTDNNTVVGVVSERYHPLNNFKLLNSITEILDGANVNYLMDKSFSKGGGAKTRMSFIFPDKQLVTRNGNDKSHLRMFVDNDFAGKGAVNISMGMFRLICSNGAVVGKVENSVAVRHLINVDANTIKMFVDFISGSFEEANTFIKNLTDFNFSSQESVANFLKNQKFVSDRYQEPMFNTWKNTYETSTNGWYVFNTLTEVITHNMRSNEFAKSKVLNELNRSFNSALNGNGVITLNKADYEMIDPVSASL